MSVTVFFLKFGLRAGAAQMSETALGVRLQLHGELRGVGFTPHPLLGASLFLLDKTAEYDLLFCCGSCVCVCVSELVQRQRRICCGGLLCPVEPFPSAICFLKILEKWDPSVSQFASLRHVLSVHVVSMSILVMNYLCCSPCACQRCLSLLPFFL